MMLCAMRFVTSGSPDDYACKFMIGRRDKASDEGRARLTFVFSIENRCMSEYRRNGSAAVSVVAPSCTQRPGEMQHGCEEEGEEKGKEEGRKEEAEVVSSAFFAR
jgi:ribosomal protein L12E/L44/L45/RPP1/RPP2